MNPGSQGRKYGGSLNEESQFVPMMLGFECLYRYTQMWTNFKATVDYTEAILQDALCHCQIQKYSSICLAIRIMHLEQTLRFIEVKKAGKRSTEQLLLPCTLKVANTYKHQKRGDQEKLSLKEQDICSYCGKKGHSRSAYAHVRQKECPAYETIMVITKRTILLSVSAEEELRQGGQHKSAISWHPMYVSWLYSIVIHLLPYIIFMVNVTSTGWDIPAIYEIINRVEKEE